MLAETRIDPSTALLKEAPLQKGESLLLVEAGDGQLALHFQKQFVTIVQQNIFYPGHKAAQNSIAQDNLANVQCILSDIPRTGGAKEWTANSFDEIVFRLGRGTALVNAVIIEAFKLLKTGGSLWVAGHNQEGIKSFAKRAQKHFGNGALIKLKSSCRLFQFQKLTSEPEKPLDDPLYFEYIPFDLPLSSGESISLLTKPGIFSYRSLDKGTELLLKYLPDCSGKSVLDLGCGCGVLSVAALKKGAKSVLGLDVNSVAVSCTLKNFKENSLPGEAICTDFTEGKLEVLDDKFDLVITNPPFHKGKDTDYSLPSKILESIHSRLVEDGSVYLVANRFLDYLKPAGKLFEECEILLSEKSYSIYRFQKRLVNNKI